DQPRVEKRDWPSDDEYARPVGKEIDALIDESKRARHGQGHHEGHAELHDERGFLGKHSVSDKTGPPGRYPVGAKAMSVEPLGRRRDEYCSSSAGIPNRRPQ